MNPRDYAERKEANRRAMRHSKDCVGMLMNEAQDPANYVIFDCKSGEYETLRRDIDACKGVKGVVRGIRGGWLYVLKRNGFVFFSPEKNQVAIGRNIPLPRKTRDDMNTMKILEAVRRA